MELRKPRGRPKMTDAERLRFLQVGMPPWVRIAVSVYAEEHGCSESSAAGAMIYSWLKRHRPDLVAEEAEAHGTSALAAAG